MHITRTTLAPLAAQDSALREPTLRNLVDSVALVRSSLPASTLSFPPRRLLIDAVFTAEEMEHLVLAFVEAGLGLVEYTTEVVWTSLWAHEGVR